jgi:hypothetical protein
MGTQNDAIAGFNTIEASQKRNIDVEQSSGVLEAGLDQLLQNSSTTGDAGKAKLSKDDEDYLKTA